MEPGFKRMLLAALRGGEYTKAVGSLHTGECFCIMGVACDITQPTWTARNQDDMPDKWKVHSYESKDSFGHVQYWHADLPEEWLERNGVSSEEQITLIHLNDGEDVDGLSFLQMADVIERDM